MQKSKKNLEGGFITRIGRQYLKFKCADWGIYQRIADKTGTTDVTIRKYDKGSRVPFDWILEFIEAYSSYNLTLQKVAREYQRDIDKGGVISRRRGKEKTE